MIYALHKIVLVMSYEILNTFAGTKTVEGRNFKLELLSDLISAFPEYPARRII